MKNNYIYQLFSTSKLLAVSLVVMLGFSGVVVGQTTIYSQNFEGTHNWTLNGNFGVNTQSFFTEHSGSDCLYTVRNGNYTDSRTESGNYSISPTISTSTYFSTKLEFWSYSDFEANYDFGYVYISGDNGATWTKVETFSATEYSWTLHSIDIAGIANNKSQVKIKFTMSSDIGDNRTGWNIDDVVIKGEACSTGFWTGNTDTNWNTASNWCNGTIPTSTTNVTIPAGVPNYPTIVSAGALCNNITIESGATLRQSSTVASNLAVYGNWTNNGTYTSGIGTTTFSGTTLQTIGGSSTTTFYNLTTSNSAGVTLGNNVTISNNLSITAGTLDCAQYQITGNATGKMIMAAGTGLVIGLNGQWEKTSNFPTLFTTANITLNKTSTVTYYGGTRSFSNVPNYGNLVIATTANDQTLDALGNLTINGTLTINQGAALRLAWSGLNTMTIGGQLIVNGTLEFDNYLGQTVNVSGDLSGTGTISMKGGSSGPHTLNLNGANNTIGKLDTDGNNSVVNYGSTGNQQVFASLNYKSLTISGGGTKTFAGTTNINNRFTINDNVKANLGNLTHTANEYYLGAALQYKGSWGSSISTATYTNDTNFDVAAPGILNTTTGACGPGYWTGATNTDWNTPSNWCDTKVPTASTNVYIPNVTNKPVIGIAGGLCKNITIETGSSLTQVDATIGASNLFVYGSWTNKGTYTSGIGTTIFAGASTQTIGGSSSTSFYDLTIQNTGGVTLNQPTTVTKTLLLISGNINSTLTNLLSVTNTSYAGIMGGSSLSYINGPIKWNLASNLTTSTLATYNFPVGNTTYLPYTLASPVTGSNPTAQVQAFNASAGTNFSSPLTAISSSEYWKLTTSNFTSSQVTLGKGDAAVYPYNVVAESSTANGAYTSIGGTSGYYDVSNSNSTNNVNYYFTLGTINSPTINVSPIVLGGFGYIFNFGPSSEQTFTVNGTSLRDGIVITAPTEYEISNTTGINFGQTITLPKDGNNNVAGTKLYIRLKAGLAVGTYNGNSINITSTDAESKKIECNGTVFATTPSIVTSGGLSCDGTEIDLFSSSSSTDISILYWNGPNNYYSQVEDPIMKPVTASMYGTYTVTGSIPTGANLIVNGDFSQGNKGFSSSYVYTTIASNDQGIYNVTDNPTTMNPLFVVPPTPGDKQLVIDGATTANVTVWSETVKVVPNSTYQFTYYLKAIYDVAHPSIIQLFANNQAVGTPFTAVAPVGTDKKYYYNWYSGSNTSVTLDLRNQSTVAIGNDFAIDDIDFRTVTQVSSSVNVTNNPTAAVTISTPTLDVATGKATGTAGANTTFTATPTNGGTAPTYVWTVTNGASVVSYPSTSSSTFNYVPADGDVIKCVMTSNSNCGNTNPKDATSNSITMMIGGNKNYWIGTTSTDWGVPGNWTVGVPAPGDNVEFANATNNVLNGGAAKKDLYVDNNRIVGNLINNASGRNLIIPANTQLYVNNKITLTPVDPSTQYTQIQIKADNTGVLTNGSLIFPNATNVYGSVEMYSKAYIDESADINGNQRYFWQYFGIPVKTLDAVPTFYGNYVRRSNEAGNESDDNYYWTELGTYDKLTQFLGYELCQKDKTTYTFQGQLVNENFDSGKLPISSNGNATDPVKYPGQHLFANSYTAAINIDKIQFGADVDNTIYLYNTGSYGQWADPTVNTSSGNAPGQYLSIPQNPSGSNGLTSQIPSMSSFLIKTGGNATDGSRVQISYKDALVKNNTLQKVKSVDGVTNTDLVSTKIDLIGQHYSDCMWIFTESSCTRNFDNGWDGRKMLGSSLAPQIYAIEPDGDYQVNSVSDMHDTDLAFQAGDEVEYTIKFTHENIQRQYAGVYLVDLLENKTVDVSQNGSTYTFATAQSDAPTKRFKILTRPYEKGAPDKDAQVKIFTAPGRVFVHNFSTSKGKCTLYDIAGRAIKIAQFEANAVTEVLNNLTPGAYVVNTITNGEKVSKRVIVQ